MAAELSTVAPETVALESLFSPCTRYRDLRLARRDLYHLDLAYAPNACEVELTARGAEEGVLTNGAWGWAELWSYIKGKRVWFSPEVYIGVPGRLFQIESLGFDCVLTVAMEIDDANGDIDDDKFRVFASSLAQAHVGCKRLLEYLPSAFGGGKLTFTPGAGWRSRTFPVSGPALSRFFSQSHGTRRLCLENFELDTDQCQAIATIDPAGGCGVELRLCQPTDEGTSALVEGVRNSRGPSAFTCCENIDECLLLEALRGNTSVKKLKCRWLTELDVRSMQALTDNLGLVELSLRMRVLNDETWGAMCESLATHPTLEELDLCHTMSFAPVSGITIGLDVRRRNRTNALVDMLRSNTKITSIELTPRDAPYHDAYDEDLLDKEVYPRLKLNEYRPRFRAVSKTEGSLREPLLGRALVAVKADASLLFLLLSGNTDINWAAIGRTRRSRKRVRYTK